MDLIRLLDILSDGKYHSGVEIGGQLGVSRTAVWKSLSKLADDGVALDVVKGKGYRIIGGLDLLSRDEILTYLESRSIHPDKLSILQSVDSTNSYLMRDDSGLQGYSLCLAERQTLGRGRRGREWHSPYAKNLYLSMSFSLSGGGEALEGLSLALGVAVANCLSSQGVKGVGLKWPNDIWVGGKKLAGILVELKGEAEFGWKVVAGVGVNVLMTEHEGKDVGQPWTSIDAVAGELSHGRSVWAAMIIESLVETLERYRAEGVDCILADWSRFDILHGRQVVLSSGGVSGMCHGIDSKGRLLVSVDGEMKSINAGEVSVRPNESSS